MWPVAVLWFLASMPVPVEIKLPLAWPDGFDGFMGSGEPMAIESKLPFDLEWPTWPRGAFEEEVHVSTYHWLILRHACIREDASQFLNVKALTWANDLDDVRHTGRIKIAPYQPSWLETTNRTSRVNGLAPAPSLFKTMILEHACMRDETWLLALSQVSEWQPVEPAEVERELMPGLEGCWEMIRADRAGLDVSGMCWISDCTFPPRCVTGKLPLPRHGVTLWRIETWVTHFDMHQSLESLVCMGAPRSDLKLWQSDDYGYVGRTRTYGHTSKEWDVIEPLKQYERTCFELRRK